MQAVLKSKPAFAGRYRGFIQDGCSLWRSNSGTIPQVWLNNPTKLQSSLARISSCGNVTLYTGGWHNDSKKPFLVLSQYGVNNSPSLLYARNIYTTPELLEKKPLQPSSKVEETVNAIKEKSTETAGAVAPAAPSAPVVKKSLREKIWHEMVHYYNGFRLLFIDINISRKLLWRVLNGKSLSRREHRLLVRTVGDLFRLLPFSVFIIVPFMELLLPVAIKLFPGMLPSTFQTAKEKDEKLKQRFKIRLEMAKFLQTTLDEMAVTSKSSETNTSQDFTTFFQKVKSGYAPTKEEILKFSKLFEDELTLDSLSRQQLTALCRVLDINPMGTTNFLRFQIRMKLRSLIADDKMIMKEGLDSLTVSELQAACQARAMRAYGLSEEKLKAQLSQWLDLSVNEKVPPSLLLLSRALMLPDTIPAADQLKATISALPDTVELKAKNAISEREGHIDNETKIQLLKEEVKAIKEERAEQREEDKKQKEQEEKEKKELLIDPAPVLSVETVLSDKQTKKGADDLSTKDLEALEDALDALGKSKKRLMVEKEELDDLKEEMQEYQEDVNELKHVLETVKNETEVKETKAAKNLFKKVNSMISKMDHVLHELEKNEEVLKADGTKDESKKAEEIVKIDELMDAIKKIQNVPDDARLAKISQILDKIDDDHDGAISVDEVLKVIELIGKEHVQLTTKQLDEIIELLDKEEMLELETQIEKALEKQAPVERIVDTSKASEKKNSSSDVNSGSTAQKTKTAATAMTASNNSVQQSTIAEPKDNNNGTSKQL